MNNNLIWNTIQSIFPKGSINYVNHVNKTFEVNGLDDLTQPNCEVLRKGEYKFSGNQKDRRSFYIVQVNGISFFFRICTAGPKSGYHEFACGNFAIDDQIKFITDSEESMKYICE